MTICKNRCYIHMEYILDMWDFVLFFWSLGLFSVYVSHFYN